MARKKTIPTKPTGPGKKQASKSRAAANESPASDMRRNTSGRAVAAGAGAVVRELGPVTSYSSDRGATPAVRGSRTSKRNAVEDRVRLLALQFEPTALKASSGEMKRKRMMLDQGLLDTVVAASGAKSEREAVRLSLAAYIDAAALQEAMLSGIDAFASMSGFVIDEDEPDDVDVFLAKRKRAKKSRAD